MTKDPSIQRKLREEIEAYVKSKGRPINPKDGLTAEMPYLDALIKEAFRLLANVPQISRKVSNDPSPLPEYPADLVFFPRPGMTARSHSSSQSRSTESPHMSLK